ncbi:MAG: hypothetical protein COA79_01395 [Planctomycetota bacterium]|nr:MAG: hypothetical protein COA79_01395 [Planctomycetota bacterium]
MNRLNHFVYFIFILFSFISCGNKSNTLREKSPLMIAIYEDNFSKVKRLIESGANKEATYGGTPMFGFVRSGKMIELLVDNGFDKDFVWKFNGTNLLAMVVSHRLNGKINPAEISGIKTFINHGLDVDNHETNNGQTIAMRVMKNYSDDDCVEICKLLKSSGANFFLKDFNDDTVLEHALRKRRENKKIVAYLKSIGLKEVSSENVNN